MTCTPSVTRKQSSGESKSPRIVFTSSGASRKDAGAERTSRVIRVNPRASRHDTTRWPMNPAAPVTRMLSVGLKSNAAFYVRGPQA